MTDAFEVLIAQSCAAPTVLLIRSSFEALLSLEYILESDSDYINRSLSWLGGYAHRRLDSYESFLPDMPRGKQYQAAVMKDGSMKDLPMPPADEVQKAVDNLRSFLARDQFAPIEAEFATSKKRPEWYRLFGGPSNLQQLSYHLNRHAQYDFLYRQWSTVTHAHDFPSFIARTTDGHTAIRGIRDPEPIRDVSRFAATFIIRATRLLLAKFRPGESFEAYYESEVRDRFLELVKV